MVRAPYYDKYGVKKGAWSEEEDQKLRDYIMKYGHGNWREVPKFAGLSRCGKSCRLRWVNYLQPNVRRGNYSAEEKEMIIKLHDDLGSRWSIIAAQLPGRTDNEIKNYWHTHLKNRDKKNRKAADEKEKQSRGWEAERNNMVESIPSNNYQILESSPLPPETPQHQSPESPELSSTSHYEQAKWVSEETMITTYGQYCTGDFWTEPFVLDTEYLAPACMEGYIPYASYNGDTDTMDLFYQVNEVMQELQENTSYLSFN